ncbi:hypothetical protein [Martelella lutilitoris]|uniref:hypothetical protein n=1 Tax=Martelella lutilitoris TaxID=2583532 RepID=UPI0016512F2D|nr:hypothetical protein [Martelella lutilitoris]
MFEYLPLFAFQTVFAAAGLTILYRMVGGRLSAAPAYLQRKPSAHDRRGPSARQ